MFSKYIVVLVIVKVAFAIYPYFDTQDFIYNVPKVYRISITLDKILDYYEKKPSKDPEWFIALGMARGKSVNKFDDFVARGDPVFITTCISVQYYRISNNTNDSINSSSSVFLPIYFHCYGYL